MDIAEVAGTGPGGRIGAGRREAVREAIVTCPRGGRTGRAAHAPLPDFSKWGAVDVKPMSNIRRKTAEHLAVAWQAPHVTQHDKADVTGARGVPQGATAPRVEKDGGKLTVTAIVIKICAAAIEKYPAVRLVGRHGERVDRLQEVHATSASPSTRRTACSCR